MPAHKIALEARLGSPIHVNDPIFPWIVEHARETINKYLVGGADGKAPYERVHGKTWIGQASEFGSVVHYRKSGKPQGGIMQPRWDQGLYLMGCLSSIEHIVLARNGDVVKTG